jgi:hypothetical protein
VGGIGGGGRRQVRTDVGAGNGYKEEDSAQVREMKNRYLKQQEGPRRETAADREVVASIKVLVVHRKDASGGRRMIRNHGELLAAIQRAEYSYKQLQGSKEEVKSKETRTVVVIVTEFVGAKHSMTESIALFSAADVVVAPHGAALGFIAFMRPGSAVVEVGYKELKVKTSEQWCEPVISISWRRRRRFFFFAS